MSSEKVLEIVIDTPLQLWCQKHWRPIVAAAATLALIVGMLLP